jgi:hypothetical protein
MAEVIVDYDLLDVVELLVHRLDLPPQECELLAVPMLIVRPKRIILVSRQCLNHNLARPKIFHKC